MGRAQPSSQFRLHALSSQHARRHHSFASLERNARWRRLKLTLDIARPRSRPSKAAMTIAAYHRPHTEPPTISVSSPSPLRCLHPAARPMHRWLGLTQISWRRPRLSRHREPTKSPFRFCNGKARRSPTEPPSDHHCLIAISAVSPSFRRTTDASTAVFDRCIVGKGKIE